MPLFSGATWRLPPGMPLRKPTTRDPMKSNTILRRLSLAVRLILVYQNAYRFFLQWLGWTSPKPFIVYKLWNGMKYKCRTNANDFGILNEVALQKMYFRHNFDNINKDSIVVDFGGQAGSFAIYIAYTTGATVYTFEPEKENYQLLLENIRLNGLEHRIIATNKAISLTDAPRTFYLSPHDNKGVHSFYYKGARTATVECIRLDQVLDLIGDRPIHLLKIDTEGAEHEFVTLGQRAFFQRAQNLVMEYHCSGIVQNHRSLESLIDTIQQIGFHVEAEGDPENGIIYASQNLVDDTARVKMKLHPCVQ